MFFASDNAGPAHPKVMEALVAANQGYALGYGADPIMEEVRAQVRTVFEAPEAAVYLVINGTSANSILLASMSQPWQTIFCADIAHIQEDECNAPEFYSQAKLTLVPFDMPEAETELSGGVLIEYSGPPLGVFKLTRAVMHFTLPVFLVALFFGGAVTAPGWAPKLWGLLAWFVLVALTVVLRNTTPRMRIDQAVKFFWGPVSLVGLAAVVLAWMGY